MRDVILRLEAQHQVWSHTLGSSLDLSGTGFVATLREESQTTGTFLCSLTQQRSTFVPSYLFSLEISIRDILLLAFLAFRERIINLSAVSALLCDKK